MAPPPVVDMASMPSSSDLAASGEDGPGYVGHVQEGCACRTLGGRGAVPGATAFLALIWPLGLVLRPRRRRE
jgi:hypothetical protein